MTDLDTQASDEADLLPCPFCGEKLIRSDYWGGTTRWHPSTGSCLLRGKMFNKAVRKQWNTRAAGDDGAADLVDALRAENERLREALADLIGPAEELCASLSASDPWSEIDKALVICSDAVADAGAALTPHGAVTPETKGET